MNKMKPKIEDIASQFTDLRRSGRELVGLCPIHKEKTPSFYVHPEKGVWHCFGCHEGGDIIELVQQVRKCGFKEAVCFLGIDPKNRPLEGRMIDGMELDQMESELLYWRRTMSAAIGDQLRWLWQLSPAVLPENLEHVRREYLILVDWQESLWTTEGLLEMWKERENIERLVL